MSRRPLKTAVLVLLALFLSFPAFAGQHPKPKTETNQTFSLRREALALWDCFFAILLKNGSGIDPFGKPVPSDPGATTQGTGDNGSGIDPFGAK